MKILLVEDSKTQARFMQAYFESLKPDWFWAKDAFEAWHLVASHPDIDIIFLDAHMPYVSAPLLIRKLKGEDVSKKIPIVVMSGDEHAVECISEGAVEFLKKPFKEHRVLDIIRLYVKS